MTGYSKTGAAREDEHTNAEYITPYSKMFSYRKSRIEERRDGISIQNHSDILQSRITSGLQVPTADESKLHSSRRNFNSLRSLSTQRYRQRTASEDLPGDNS